jgi:hypothetical protein
MAALANASTWALMAVTQAAGKLHGLCPNMLRRWRIADEEQAEPGINLGPMESTGVRHRRILEQAPGPADDSAESPTTTSTSGTFTPGTSEGSLDNPGMILVQVYPRYRSAKAGDA